MQDKNFFALYKNDPTAFSIAEIYMYEESKCHSHRSNHIDSALDRQSVLNHCLLKVTIINSKEPK